MAWVLPPPTSGGALRNSSDALVPPVLLERGRDALVDAVKVIEVKDASLGAG